jgi:hypothetical protein
MYNVAQIAKILVYNYNKSDVLALSSLFLSVTAGIRVYVEKTAMTSTDSDAHCDTTSILNLPKFSIMNV